VTSADDDGRSPTLLGKLRDIAALYAPSSSRGRPPPAATANGSGSSSLGRRGPSPKAFSPPPPPPVAPPPRLVLFPPLALPCAGGAGGAPGSPAWSSSAAAAAAAAADRALALEARVAAVGAAGVRLGELAHLLRPLIYVLLLRKHGPRSWRPWLASLAVELASGLATRKGHGLAAEARARAALGGALWPPPRTSLRSLALLQALASPRWRPAEGAELLGRRLALARYLLRSPAYERATRPALAAAARGVRWVPLAAPAARFALELVDGMQGYYTYVEG